MAECEFLMFRRPGCFEEAVVEISVVFKYRDSIIWKSYCEHHADLLREQANEHGYELRERPYAPEGS